MPRNMSFMLTTDQIKNKKKTVTRRLGWWFLKPGDILNACEKCQGLKKGEKIKKLCKIQIVSVRKELLNDIFLDDCAKEGFPKLTNWGFIQMFMREMKCSSHKTVNRIEFKYI